MARQPRQSVLFGDFGQSGDQPGRHRAGAARIDIEAAFGGGDLDVERFAHRGQRLGDGPSGLERAVEMRVENRTAVDRHDVVRIGRREADIEHVVGAEPRVEGDAATAGAVGIDQRRDLALNSGLRQRRHHDVALPGAIAFGFPVLDRATAADAEMRTKRRDPLRAFAFDPDQSPAVGMVAGDRCDLDGFAAQCVRHIDAFRADGRNTVAAMADVIDDEMLDVSHGAPR